MPQQFLPSLPVELQSEVPPAQTITGYVNQMRQSGNPSFAAHAQSFENLQQNVDSLGNYLNSLLTYIRNLTQQTIGTLVSASLVNSYTLTGAYADVPEMTITLPVPGIWYISASADVRGAAAGYVIQIRLSDGTIQQQPAMLASNSGDPGVCPVVVFGYYTAQTQNVQITLQARYATAGATSFIAGSATSGNTILTAVCVAQQIQQQ